MTPTDFSLKQSQRVATEKYQKSKQKRFFGWTLGSIFSTIWYSLIFLLVVLAVLKFFFFQQVTVVGDSMKENFETGQVLIVQQQFNDHQRGDVVAVYANSEEGCRAGILDRFTHGFLLKRIIGLPGESIEIQGSKVIIYNPQNPEGMILEEDYISEAAKLAENIRQSNDLPKTKISENSYFVMGDNRPNSLDSRNPSVGEFAECAVLGRAIYRVWPIKDISSIETVKY